MTQREENPYKYSDSNKRYYTYDYYLKKRFGGKVGKVSLDIGSTCPNIDGTCGSGGCIYCLNGSSSSVGESIQAQYENGVNIMTRKWQNIVGFIPYLQANSNTYGNIERLKQIYSECISLDRAVMLAIATRADCLSDEIMEELKRVNEKIPLMIELGLQSSDDRTAEKINRGHSYSQFIDGYNKLRKIDNVFISIHIINGLPDETHDMMLKTATDVADLHPEMVKIHLCHVLKGTVLGDMYEKGLYTPMEKEDYVSTVCDQLEVLPPDTVIGRITGDGMRNVLLAPEWSVKKTDIANNIDKTMYMRKSCQGIKYHGGKDIND